MDQSSKYVVGFSGGVTSAWVAGWALRNYPKDDVILLFHDTKEEHPDTYRFIKEMSQVLNHSITEQSDGRSVTQLFYDEDCLANNRMAFCSKILKAQQRDKFFKMLKKSGVETIVNHLGFSSQEWQRIQKATMRAEQDGYKVRFPVAEEKVTKQRCADWCNSLGVKPSEMYKWSQHANCIGCVRGGKAYWLEVSRQHPEIFNQRVELEKEFGHTFLPDTTLIQLQIDGLKRKVNSKEMIEITCECGD